MTNRTLWSWCARPAVIHPSRQSACREDRPWALKTQQSPWSTFGCKVCAGDARILGGQSYGGSQRLCGRGRCLVIDVIFSLHVRALLMKRLGQGASNDLKRYKRKWLKSYQMSHFLYSILYLKKVIIFIKTKVYTDYKYHNLSKWKSFFIVKFYIHCWSLEDGVLQQHTHRVHEEYKHEFSGWFTRPCFLRWW